LLLTVSGVFGVFFGDFLLGLLLPVEFLGLSSGVKTVIVGGFHFDLVPLLFFKTRV
jgi:hypothetical protein